MEARISKRGDQVRFEDRKATHQAAASHRGRTLSASSQRQPRPLVSADSAGSRQASAVTTCSPGTPEPCVPDDVREFIIKHIATVPQIEALLLIWSSPEKRWSLRQVAARIYTGEAEAARALDGLCTGGLLVHREGSFTLASSAENVDMIGKLEEVYARYLIPVTDVIHGKSRGEPPATRLFRSGRCD